MSLDRGPGGRDMGRLRVRVRGAVQGVGFRPFVHGLAVRFGLSGYVLNDAEGVLAEVEGPGVDLFLVALHYERPSMARIDGLETTVLPPQGGDGFVIRPSIPGLGSRQTSIGPDTAPCQRCLDELFDPVSRFHSYPFVTCTQCGPRFTVTRRLPYDRANTSLAGFAPCPACAADYLDPGSRRFHAETIACAACGPALSHSIAAIATVLRQGGIVALKGIGGFHLLCDATDDAAVSELRIRKQRLAKPFAIMAADVDAITPFAVATPAERALLLRPCRPIVLLQAGRGLALGVSPGLGRIGVMLPSAPLHHLLFQSLGGVRAVVATSANASGEPLAMTDAEARADLVGIADMIVTHGRAIVARTDDSLMQMVDGAPTVLRRSRGIVPEPIDLGEDGPCVLAAGGHLKATICVTRGREAFLSQHIGDLDTVRTIRFYEATARRMLAALGVTPELVACDLHPDYRSTLFAEAMGLPILRVQHHAAHLAAVAAEHKLRGPVLGVALDGYGYGEGGAAWGGELMLRQGVAWQRLGHLWPLAMPGGDRAAREPWRMGVAALAALGRGAEAGRRFPGVALAGPAAALLARQTGMETSSMGRLFDAAAALLGVSARMSYEGQAGLQLEALVRETRCLAGGWRISGGVLDFRPLLAGLLAPGMTMGAGAGLFHGTVIAGLAEWIAEAACTNAQTTVVLGGGCLANVILAEGLADALRARGLVPLFPRIVPTNDGGLSFGQAAYATGWLLNSLPV